MTEAVKVMVITERAMRRSLFETMAAGNGSR